MNGAFSLEGKIQNSVSPSGALPSLNKCQLEEMALQLYGPGGHLTKPSLQYYIPFCGTKPQMPGQTTCSVGWQWGINTTPLNRCGVCYVMDVRNAVPPKGSKSSCTATDPPTGLTCTNC